MITVASHTPPNPAQPPLDLVDAERQHALEVDCPPPPAGCGQPAGQRCLGPVPADGGERGFFPGPGHHGRIKAADAAHPERARPAIADAGTSPATSRIRRFRDDLVPHLAECEHCHKPIVWAYNPKGRRVPVDAEPHPSAVHDVIVLFVDAGGFVRATYLATEGQARGARAHGQSLHLPHRETCRFAHRWSPHKR